MKKSLGRYSKIGLGVALLLTVVAIGFYLNHSRETVVMGTVTNVISRPNTAENGYYGFDVRDGQKVHRIDATGFMNTPAQPSDFGKKCVDTAAVKIGDKVEFKLPKAENGDAFTTCYDAGQAGYFFRIK